MKRIGIIGIFTTLAAASAGAMDADMSCPGFLEEKDRTDDFSVQSKQLLLMDNQCEVPMSRELRVPLLEIPQEEEDPMALSLGAKHNGVILRLKVPFSF